MTWEFIKKHLLLAVCAATLCNVIEKPWIIRKEERPMSILEGKKVVIIGDRDGVPGEAIQPCVESAGGEVVFSSTECFV